MLHFPPPSRKGRVGGAYQAVTNEGERSEALVAARRSRTLLLGERQFGGTPMQKTLGITYATHDGVALQGDLYTPEGSGPFPALVAVHGGGWQLGTRESYKHWAPYLTAAGYALFSVDYRLSKPQQKSYPQAVHDIRAAVQYLRGAASDLKIDGKRIALIGDSAGGHLAALVALAGDAPVFADGCRDDAYASVST